MQINGVDMTEARHDHAVSLLTAASPTIALLLEREAGGPLAPSPPPHSPPPPTATPATPGEPGPLRLPPSLLAAALEGPYPVEVRPLPWPCPPTSPCLHSHTALGVAVGPARGRTRASALSSQAPGHRASFRRGFLLLQSSLHHHAASLWQSSLVSHTPGLGKPSCNVRLVPATLPVPPCS